MTPALGSFTFMSISGGTSAWIRTNRGTALIMSAVFLVLMIYLLTQDWVYDQQRYGFRLGFFTVLSAAAMLICCLSMVFDRQKDQTTPEMSMLKLRHLGRAAMALIIMGIYFIFAWNDHFAQDWLRPILDTIPLTGEFLLWTPIFMGAGMYLLGVRPLRSAFIAAIIITVVIFGLFRIIGITLPSVLLS